MYKCQSDTQNLLSVKVLFFLEVASLIDHQGFCLKFLDHTKHKQANKNVKNKKKQDQSTNGAYGSSDNYKNSNNEVGIFFAA